MKKLIVAFVIAFGLVAGAVGVSYAVSGGAPAAHAGCGGSAC